MSYYWMENDVWNVIGTEIQNCTVFGYSECGVTGVVSMAKWDGLGIIIIIIIKYYMLFKMVPNSDISVNWNGIGTEIILNQLTGTGTGTWIIPGTRTELERNLFKIVGTGTNSNDN